MDQRFKKINMDDVRNIIAQKGFYYLPLSRIYDNFKVCKYIIITLYKSTSTVFLPTKSIPEMHCCKKRILPTVSQRRW